MKAAFNLTFLLVVSLITSCKVSKYATSIPKRDFIFAYKAEACTLCLTQLGVEIKNDNSFWLRFEVLGDHFKQQARLEGKKFVDSVNHNASYFKGADLEGGKAITNGCLILFESHQLDSAAKAAYKQYVKHEKAIWNSL